MSKRTGEKMFCPGYGNLLRAPHPPRPKPFLVHRQAFRVPCLDLTPDVYCIGHAGPGSIEPPGRFTSLTVHSAATYREIRAHGASQARLATRDPL